MLSTTTVGIGGVLSDDGMIPYVLAGTVDTQGALVAGYRPADSGGPGPSQPYPIRQLEFDDHGGLRPRFEDSFPPYLHSSGAAFMRRQGSPAGWYSGYDDSAARGQFSFLAEPADGAMLTDFAGSWGLSFLHTEWTDGSYEADVRYGSAEVSGSQIDWIINRVGREPKTDTDTILSVTTDGRLITSHEGYESIQMAAGKQLALYVDLDRADSEASAGLLYRVATDRTMMQIAGTYRVGMVVTGSLARSIAGTSVAMQNLVLVLSADGTYRQFDVASFDAGERRAAAAGTWTHESGTVLLSQTGRGLTWNLAVGGDGQSLLPRFYLTPRSADQPVLGLGVRAATASTPVFTVSQTAPGGRAVVYELHDDKGWRSVDLVSKSGGPDLKGGTVTWEDQKDGLQYAAGIGVDDTLVLYRRAASGAWSSRVLSDDLPGSGRIVSDLNVMVGADGLVHLSGLDSRRDLLEFRQTGGVAYGSEFEWQFHHRGDELRAAGLAMPVFSGPLVSYATRWNGLNIAGLDADGHIWSVWWAPGMDSWRSDDLTVGLGARALTGGLTVYLTSWNGINLAGIDESGHLRVTWWVPGFQSWEQSDLTAQFDGPALSATSVSSYVSSWDGLNVAGIDRTTGEIKVYWWAPGLTTWQVASMTSIVPAGSPRPVHDLHGLAGDDSSLNVLGRSEDGHLVRLFWTPGMGGSWAAQDLTVLAIDA